jgi:hypothetical protein
MTVDTNIWGVVISLEHSEVADGDPRHVAEALGGAGGVLSAVLAAANVAAGVIGLIVGIVEAAIAATWAGITAADKGYGTYCTIPWPTIFALGPIIIPTTRPVHTPLPAADWATSASGSFGTGDAADKISYTIQHGAAPVPFIGIGLIISPESSGTWKSLQTASGPALQIQGKGASNRIYDGFQYYISPDARLIFMKVKEFGSHPIVLRLGGLNQLRMQDLVTFTWETD